MPLDPRSFHHVGIVVRDLDASAAWYQRHLGLERLGAFEFPGTRVVMVGRGDLRLELFQVDGAAPMASQREQPPTNLRIGGINHLAITVDDLDQAVADLQGAGVEVVVPPRDVPDGSGRFAFVHDNEKMLVELLEPKR